MGNASYKERVPENVRKQEAEKLQGYEAEMATLDEQAERIAKFQ